MGYKSLFFILIWCFFTISIDTQAQNGKINTVVIDPGHGGRDGGAVGSQSLEKDITLKVALKAGEYIKKTYPNLNVIYTRSKDVSVSLNSRASTANDNNADIFISIHCNSIDNAPKTRGVETFVMGAHRDADNLKVAKSENSSILYEENTDENYGDFNPNSTETHIAMDYLQSEFKQESLTFAELVQNEIVKIAKRYNRGVQQAGFLVLCQTAMPSILIEIGFISNPEEEKFLMSEEGQNSLALAISQAFCTYKSNYEKEAQAIAQNTPVAPQNPVAPEKPVAPQNPVAPEKPVAQNKPQQTETPVVKSENEVVYKVQFIIRDDKLSNPSDVYKGLQDVDCYKHKGAYKYTAGRFSKRADAMTYQKEVVKKGYKDAFIVKFVNGKRTE